MHIKYKILTDQSLVIQSVTWPLLMRGETRVMMT